MTYAAEVLADSPLVYWRLGEASGTFAADASGNANVGTYFGSPALGNGSLLIGDADTAVGFGTVTSQRIESDTPVHGTSTLTSFAMECLLTVPASGGPDSLLSIADPAQVAGESIQLAYQDGYVFFSFTGTSGFGNSAAAVSAGAHHVVAEFTGTEINLYVDGVLITSDSFVDAGALFTVAASFGVPWVGTGSTLIDPHDIDEAAFYTHDLGLARVQAHAAAAGYFSPGPTISLVSPAYGIVDGGDTIIVTGANFTGVTGVFFDGFLASFTVDSDTQITVTTPAHVVGNVSVQVNNDFGTALETFDYTVDGGPPAGPTAPDCMALSFPGFLADGVTPDGDTIIYTVQALDGWFDSPPIRTGTLEANPRGETITVARENARTVDVQIVAHVLGGLPLGSPLCFTAIRSIKAAFRALYVPVLMDVIDPSGQERTLLARRVGPIKSQILGDDGVAVRFNIPMLGEDPRLTTV